MLTKQGVAITFYAFYVDSTNLDGETLLTPTVDVYEATAGTPIVSGGSASELGGGLYYYTLASGSVDLDGAYVAVFKSASTAVVQKWLPAIWQVGTTLKAVDTLTGHTAQTGDTFARLGSPVGASVSADIAAVKGDAAAILADTGTDGVVLANDAITAAKFDETTAFPVKSADTGATQIARVGSAMTLADDAITAAKFDESTAFPVKSADTGATQIARVGADGDTLKTLSDQIDTIDTDAIAADLWTYSPRTLTQSAASVAAAVAGAAITITRGDTLSAEITGLGNISARTKLWFTVKSDKAHPDAAAIIQITEAGGLLILNGTSAATPANGSITVTQENAGRLTIALSAAETDDLPIISGYYDIQMLTATGVTTLSEGACTVSPDVTRAVA